MYPKRNPKSRDKAHWVILELRYSDPIINDVHFRLGIMQKLDQLVSLHLVIGVFNPAEVSGG